MARYRSPHLQMTRAERAKSAALLINIAFDDVGARHTHYLARTLHAWQTHAEQAPAHAAPKRKTLKRSYTALRSNGKALPCSRCAQTRLEASYQLSSHLLTACWRASWHRRAWHLQRQEEAGVAKGQNASAKSWQHHARYRMAHQMATRGDIKHSAAARKGKGAALRKRRRIVT